MKNKITNSIVEPKRNIDFDVLKGIAIVMSHLVAQNLHSLPSDYYFMYIQGYSHVPVFFLISGYLSHNGIVSGGKSFIKKRAIRLLLPYTSWSLVAIGARELFNVMSNNFSIQECGKDIFNTFIYAKSMWFFIALFITVIFVKAIYAIQDSKRILLFFSVVLIALPTEIKIFGFDMVQILAIIFVLGYILDGKWTIIVETIKNSLCLKILSVLLLFTSPWYCMFTSTVSLPIPLHRLMVVLTEIACIFFIIAIVLPIIRKNKLIYNGFAVFGVYSLEIYCIHMFFVEYVMIPTPEAILNSIQIVSVIYYFVYAVIIISAVVLISMYMLNRIGIYNLLMRGIQVRKESQNAR